MTLEALQWRDRQVQTHLGMRSLPSTVIQHPDSGAEFIVYDVGSQFPDTNKQWTRPLTEITGHAWHHDAVAFSGSDVDFDGHTSDEEFARLAAIHRFHTVNNPWNGIGYHCVGGLEDRLYVPRRDVLSTHRAHVSGRPVVGPNWNRQLIGFCHMGNYADRLGPDGRTIAPIHDRPPAQAMAGAQAWFQTVTNVLNLPRALTLRGHKAYQAKPCPGDWATAQSWVGVEYRPRQAASVPQPPTSTNSVPPRLSLTNDTDLMKVFQAIGGTNRNGHRPLRRVGTKDYYEFVIDRR